MAFAASQEFVRRQPDVRSFTADLTMIAPFRIALVGLAPVERTLVEATFAQQRPDGASHEMVDDPARADLVILDAEDTRALQHFRARGLAAPVLLIGHDVAGAHLPAVPRPIRPHALLDVAARLLSGSPASRSATALVPAFQATVPFAPLERPRLRDVADGFDETRSFQETQPFERSAPGAPVPQRPGPARTAVHDSISAQSVLLWRDAKSGTTDSSGTPSAARDDTAPRKPAAAELPAVAGFEPTRVADPQEFHEVPANWRELARQRDKERSQRAPPDAEPYSSSFADPSDHPTSPPALARSPAILLVGESRLGGSSLIRELRSLGCQVDHAQDTEAALARLAAQLYGFAFLDDRSLGRQTRAVCRALRRRARALGQTLTIVVMARDEGPLRRLLARWAGCDTWMTLPLERRRLARFLLGGSDLASGA